MNKRIHNVWRGIIIVLAIIGVLTIVDDIMGLNPPASKEKIFHFEWYKDIKLCESFCDRFQNGLYQSNPSIDYAPDEVECVCNIIPRSYNNYREEQDE